MLIFYAVHLHSIMPHACRIMAQCRTVHETSMQKVPSVLLSELFFCFVFGSVLSSYTPNTPMHSKYTPNTHICKLQADIICPFCSFEKCTKSSSTKIWPMHILCTPNTRLCKLQAGNICSQIPEMLPFFECVILVSPSKTQGSPVHATSPPPSIHTKSTLLNIFTDGSGSGFGVYGLNILLKSTKNHCALSVWLNFVI